MERCVCVIAWMDTWSPLLLSKRLGVIIYNLHRRKKTYMETSDPVLLEPSMLAESTVEIDIWNITHELFKHGKRLNKLNVDGYSP